MKTFGGKVLFLDRGDINTDEIIPAARLTENTKAALKPYLFEGLELPGFDRPAALEGAGAVVGRRNFGCGSSREHAPWALEANNITIVIAESFARIFRQNMYNCGLIALALPQEELDGLFRGFAGFPTVLTADIGAGVLTFNGGGAARTLRFTLNGFERALVEAGGWIPYAASHYERPLRPLRAAEGCSLTRNSQKNTRNMKRR
jgi:3-isopropylmalate/(R)-2-methylmalate dehydratase small subunit